MIRIFLDSDIVFECFLNRKKFAKFPKELWGLLKSGYIQAYISDYAFRGISTSLLSFSRKVSTTNKIKYELLENIKVFPVTHSAVQKARSLEVMCFSASVDIVCAQVLDCILVTQNQEKYSNSSIKTLSVREIIQRINLEKSYLDSDNISLMNGDLCDIINLENVFQESFKNIIIEGFSFESPDFFSVKEDRIFGAKFVNSILSNLVISNRELIHVSFFNSILAQSRFISTELRYSNFSQTNLSNATFMNCCLCNSKLASSITHNSLFHDCEISLTDFQKSILIQSDFIKSNLNCSNFSKSNMESCKIIKSNFNNTFISDSNLSNTLFQETSLIGAHLTFSNGTYSKFIDSNLRLAKLSNSDFSNAKFVNCELIETDFSDCNLSGAVFENVDLSRAKFDRAILKDVKFKTCTLV